MDDLLHRAALRAALAATALALGLTACRQSVDLASLQTLAKTTAQSQATFATLANDFYDSCTRTVGWQRAAEPTASPNVFIDCSEEAKAARQWQAANSVVTSYVASLGALAGGGADPGDYGLSGFVAAVAQISPAAGHGVFSESQRGAAVKASASLITDYFNVRRRDALAKIVPAADADLATMISTLEDVARTNYVTQLTTERIAIGLFFEPNIARARPGLETLIAFDYRSTEHAQKQRVDERQAAVDHYVAALEQIRATHHAIADAVAHDRTADVAAIVQAYLTEYGPELSALQKALK